MAASKLNPDDLATQLIVAHRSPVQALRAAEVIGSSESPNAKPFAIAASLIRDKLRLEWKTKGYIR